MTNAYQMPYQMGPAPDLDGAKGADDLGRPLYGASFGVAVKRFFRQYATFSGRASRSEFWWAALFLFLLQLIPVVLYMIGIISASVWVASAAAADDDGTGYYATPGLVAAPLGFLIFVGGGLMFLISLGTFIPQLAMIWRRLHDANMAGPFYFLTLVPFGGIIVLIFFCMSPKVEGRRFDLPRGPQHPYGAPPVSSPYGSPPTYAPSQPYGGPQPHAAPQPYAAPQAQPYLPPQPPQNYGEQPPQSERG